MDLGDLALEPEQMLDPATARVLELENALKPEMERALELELEPELDRDRDPLSLSPLAPSAPRLRLVRAAKARDLVCACSR